MTRLVRHGPLAAPGWVWVLTDLTAVAFDVTYFFAPPLIGPVIRVIDRLHDALGLDDAWRVR